MIFIYLGISLVSFLLIFYFEYITEVEITLLDLLFMLLISLTPAINLLFTLISIVSAYQHDRMGIFNKVLFNKGKVRGKL